MRIAGIDYSMTSPAITIYDSETREFNHYFYTSNKKLFWQGNFHGTLHAEWKTPEERFERISEWAMNVVAGVDYVFLEGYAFGARGLVFHIGENTGLLKHKLWKANIPFEVPGPTQIKKFATGKGNAKKTDMEVAFVEKTRINVKKMIGQKEKDENPSSDIIDSYFLTTWGLQRLNIEA